MAAGFEVGFVHLYELSSEKPGGEENGEQFWKCRSGKNLKVLEGSSSSVEDVLQFDSWFVGLGIWKPCPRNGASSPHQERYSYSRVWKCLTPFGAAYNNG